MAQQSDYLEVKPRLTAKTSAVGLICLLFAGAGLWMMMAGSGSEVFYGLLSFVLFGGVGGFFIRKVLGRQVSLVLTPEGIEQRTPWGSATIPWREIEAIGTFRMQLTNNFVGLRLYTYDYYLDHMSEQLARFYAKSIPYLRLVAKGVQHLPVHGGAAFLAKSQGGETLKSVGKAKSVEDLLRASRESSGYDITFSEFDLDRSPKNFAVLLTELWRTHKPNP
jgi:hypothetical protein